MNVLLVLAGIISLPIAIGIMIVLGLLIKKKGWKWVLIPAGAVAIGFLIYLILPLGKNEKISPPPRAAVSATAVVRWAEPVQIKAPSERWSEPHPVPSGLFKIVPSLGEKAEILFSNGKYLLLDSYEQTDIGNASGEFQLRGVGKEVTVFIYRQK